MYILYVPFMIYHVAPISSLAFDHSMVGMKMPAVVRQLIPIIGFNMGEISIVLTREEESCQ